MTSDQFAYWLQGFTELNGAPPNAEQWESIKDHLKLVFAKVTPQRQQIFPQISPTVAPQPFPPSMPSDWMKQIEPRYVQPGQPWLDTTVTCLASKAVC